MKKTGILAAALLAGSTFLAGCSGDQNANAEVTTDLQIGIVTDTAGVNDRSFNQAAWEGLQLFAEGHGLVRNENYRYLVSETDADYVPHMMRFAEEGFDLTIAMGFRQQPALEEVAAIKPDAYFAIIDSTVEKDNVVSVNFKEHEGSFLAGVAAAMTTETDVVGFVGGVRSGLIERFEAGFIQGVHAVNPDIQVITEYVDSFSDAAAGATLAAAMFGQGADVIYHAAGGAGNGVFTEAQNRSRNGENVWVIGVDRDQHEEGMPENVTLTSMVKRVDEAVYRLATLLEEGDFPAGETIYYGLAENGVDISSTRDNLSEEALEAIERFRNKIISGEITVVPSLAEME